MTVPEIMADLQAHGSESIKKILLKHGIKEPFFGVKIEHLKIIQKQVNTDYPLALGLYATGNADAQYLAGLITDDMKMTKADLQTWAEEALSANIAEYTVPWVATGSAYGFELALEWIDDTREYMAVAGWATLNNIAALKADDKLDISAYRALLGRVVKTIHGADNRVKSVMNNFLIAIGTYIAPLTDEVITAANHIGAVMVDKGDTACKVPDAVAYIAKAHSKGPVKKKKTVKC